MSGSTHCHCSLYPWKTGTPLNVYANAIQDIAFNKNLDNLGLETVEIADNVAPFVLNATMNHGTAELVITSNEFITLLRQAVLIYKTHRKTHQVRLRPTSWSCDPRFDEHRMTITLTETQRVLALQASGFSVAM